MLLHSTLSTNRISRVQLVSAFWTKHKIGFEFLVYGFSAEALLLPRVVRPEPKTTNQKPSSENLKLQERLTDDDLVSVLKHLSLAWKKPSAAVHKRAVGRAQILDEVLAVMIYDASMTARYLRFRIVLIQIDIREYAAVGVPSPDVSFDASNRELSSDAPAALDNKPRLKS
jgi:hypothetical protein